MNWASLSITGALSPLFSPLIHSSSQVLTSLFCFLLPFFDGYGCSHPEVLLPGRHLLLSPLNRFNRTFSMSADLIEVYPVTLVRVPVGSLGLAHDNAHPVVLLPGLHCYNDGNWKFMKPPGVSVVTNGNHCVRADQEVIDFGPIKFITVKSGTVRVCYLKGKVHIFEEGRYAVNDPTCIVSNLIKTQQQVTSHTSIVASFASPRSLTSMGLLRV